MLPLLPNQRVSQNKISGVQLAWGQAQWQTKEDGVDGYVFPDGALVVAQSMNHLEAQGVTLDAMFDCIDQFEAAYVSPEDMRSELGLLKDFGETSPGMVVRSSKDPRIKCIFTPASWEVSETEGYFQWFLDDDLTNSLANYDELAGVDTSPVPEAPAEVPWYEEACEKINGLPITETRKNAFLQSVWDYHKNLMPGYKAEAKVKICAEYATLLKTAPR